MRLTPPTELESRAERLRHRMDANGIDAVIIIQNADLFYFTGSVQNGVFILPLSGEPLYMVRRHQGRARMESGLRNLVPIDSLHDVPRLAAAYGIAPPACIGLELDVLPVSLCEGIRAIYPASRIVDASTIIRETRMIKSAYEIHAMMDAAIQVDRVHRAAFNLIREGMTDLELASALESVARNEGHPGYVRMRSFNGELVFGQLFSGSDSAIPSHADAPLGGMGVTPAFPQGAGYNRIERNTPIVVRFSGSMDGYLVDQTRMFVVGALDDHLLRAFSAMLKIQERMEGMAPERPTWGELYDESLRLAHEMGYEECFMGAPGGRATSIGHGIGVEIDEFPIIAPGFHDRTIEPGMAWAFEPTVVIPGSGAVGIKNSYYLALDGSLKRLTLSPDQVVPLS